MNAGDTKMAIKFTPPTRGDASRGCEYVGGGNILRLFPIQCGMTGCTSEMQSLKKCALLLRGSTEGDVIHCNAAASTGI